MRDVAVLLFLIASVVAAFKKPWLGVLALAIFGYMAPHRLAWGFIVSLPVYQVMFLAVAVAFLKTREGKQPLPRDWRVTVFFILWIHFFITTLDAAVPGPAWTKFVETSKIYLPLLFTLVLIDTREKLFYLIITIAGSIGLIAAKGGIFAIGTGFSFRVWGPPGSMLYGNNEFAIATLMAIPLVILWLREAKDKRLRIALMAAVGLMFASAISSHSRGALLTIGVLTLVLLRRSRKKWLALPVVVLGVIAAIQVLPDEWFNRMETIQSYEHDRSAMGRIEAWQDGIEYALSNPLTGAGFNGWIYVTMRDWHSAYVEALAEHGFVGLFLWLSLLYGSIFSLSRLPRLTRHIPEMAWVENYSYMLRASLIAYAVGSVFLGITYWDLLYHLVFISVLVKKFALEELAQREGRASVHRPWVNTAAVRPAGS
jgi:probable O-glycosylation ligase (exosortase A-associated)